MARPATPPYGERVLQLKPTAMTGRDVWDLQIKLMAWGSGTDADGIGSPNMPVRVNGTFDRATRDAVKRFQNALVLPITGIADERTFAAIDDEAGRWPVLVWPLRCPCADGKNVAPIRCRCSPNHPSEGVCTGFGNARFNGQFLLDAVTLPDGTALATEQLDIYDMREYAGIDKALLWAVRGLMRRANVPRIKIAAGYRCWQDNYQHTDARRWRHRKSTFHLGKMVEFYHDGTCAEYGQNPNAAPCGTCSAIRTVALTKCGFQERWQLPDVPTAGEVGRMGPPPSNPFAVSVSTVRRRDRHEDEFVSTYHDSLLPLYPGKAPAFSLPINLNNAGLDVRTAPTGAFYAATEGGQAGWYPVGLSRMWHTGVHLYAGAATEVRVMADGVIVGVRGGEATTAKTLGSRNFVLIKHEHNTQVWYSLYMHLDAGAIDAASLVPWRKVLFSQTVDHVHFKEPGPTFTHVPTVPAAPPIPAVPSHLVPMPGHGIGARIPLMAAAAAADPRAALDAKAPPNSEVIQLAAPPDTYVFLKMENNVLAEKVDADAALNTKIGNHDVIGLDKPVRVRAGELIGYIGDAPTEATLQPHGAFLHLEVFSETQILTGTGYTLVDAAAATQVADRKQVALKLKAAKLVEGLPNDVLLDSDLNINLSPVSLLPMRSVVLRTPNQWEMDWKASLAAAASLSFMPDAARDTLGDLMNEYRWWAGVAGGTRLPASSTVYHYHPLALLFHYALA